MQRLMTPKKFSSSFQWHQALLFRSLSYAASFAEASSQMLDLEPTHMTERNSYHFQTRKALHHMTNNNVPIDESSLMSLIDSTVSSGGFSSYSHPFTQFQEFIDSDLCNSIIRRYNDLHKYGHSVYVYIQMRKIGIPPDYSTFPSVLKASSKSGRWQFGKWIHCFIIHIGYQSDVYVSTALVTMYGNCRLVEDAHGVFDEMPLRNSVSWNALITAYTHNRMFKEAIHLFREMQYAGFEPGEVTMVGVLSACAHLGALNQGQWIHEYIKNNSVTLTAFVGTALIDMYTKCGLIDAAEEVFDEMRVKSNFTWNVLIYGYAMNGQGESAMKTFSKMLLENFKPDIVSFLGVLCACCHEGLVDEGKRLFKSMQEEFGLLPRIEHYGCMVDLLGRAGFLNEAQQLIQTMRVRPDPIIWRSLLGACRIHRNFQLSEFAIKKLLELEPKNAENYILLSNLYARDQKWVRAGEVRKMMENRGIKKVPGCSSTEINNVVYEFFASDVVVPGLEDVYKLLLDSKEELKHSGYVADTGMALYDVEDEEKEQSMMYHSEKVALAFGLLKSPPNSTLRIIKNLRVCQDCHSFFKIVSKVYERHISLRDRNRYHHFAGGACSCRDFW